MDPPGLDQRYGYNGHTLRVRAVSTEWLSIPIPAEPLLIPADAAARSAWSLIMIATRPSHGAGSAPAGVAPLRQYVALGGALSAIWCGVYCKRLRPYEKTPLQPLGREVGRDVS
jgi:hypothetical protein